MSIRPVLTYPDPRLHKVARPVELFDARLEQLIADMLETMYAQKGVGLAATQIDVHERVLVMDVSDDKNQPLVVINPRVVWHSEEVILGEEGCLSVPGFVDKVQRYAQIHVCCEDAHGKTYSIEAQDLLAVCIQHEMDHLMGKVYVQYLSPLKRDRIRARLLKEARLQERELASP